MTEQGQYVPADISVVVAKIEDQLAGVLLRTTKDISHSECFDDEQRAEIYTILQTLKADTCLHRDIVGRWVSQSPREAAHA